MPGFVVVTRPCTRYAMPLQTKWSPKPKGSKPSRMGVGVVLGIALGAAMGAALDNVAMGIVIGVVLGVAMSQQRKDEDE